MSVAHCISDLSLATRDGANPYSMIEGDAPGYLGSAAAVTRPNYSAAVPSQATPSSIAATADSLIGQAWNRNGCWALATDVQHMMALDLFDVAVVAGSGHIAGSLAGISAIGAPDIDPAIRGMLLPFHE